MSGRFFDGNEMGTRVLSNLKRNNTGLNETIKEIEENNFKPDYSALGYAIGIPLLIGGAVYGGTKLGGYISNRMEEEEPVEEINLEMA